MPAKPLTDANYAFMPSSNDALFSPFHHHIHVSSAPASYNANGYFHRDSSAVASPSLSACAHTDGLPGTPSIPSNMLSPQRDQIPSASSLPLSRSGSLKRKSASAALDTRPPAEDDHWHHLYNKLQSIIENERNLWRLERQKLNTEINTLRNEVKSLKANDRGLPTENEYFNQDVVAQAQEKLRQLSQVQLSPHSSRENSVVGVREKEGSISARLPSITEERDGKSVQFERPTEALTIIHKLDQEDDPMSPPQTAKPLSPPPENFLRHAGHTPLARSGRASFHEEQTKKLEVINEKWNDPAALDADDDPCLKGPLVLAPSPEENPMMLKNLDKRLQNLVDAELDDVKLPECMKGQEEERSDEKVEPATEASTETGDVVDGGIKLKVKRSMNFGAPLGAR